MKERTEKKRRGSTVVLAILLLATIGAGLTWLRYTGQAPSTTKAQLISDRMVQATFHSNDARNIREGAKAIVTFETAPGQRFEGAVESLETGELETKVSIILEAVPPDAQLHSRCSVTVDTSVSSSVRSD